MARVSDDIIRVEIQNSDAFLLSIDDVQKKEGIYAPFGKERCRFVTTHDFSYCKLRTYYVESSGKIELLDASVWATIKFCKMSEVMEINFRNV